MIDIKALDNDPWTTSPVNKDDLRELMAENARLREALQDSRDYFSLMADELESLGLENTAFFLRRYADYACAALKRELPIDPPKQ